MFLEFLLKISFLFSFQQTAHTLNKEMNKGHIRNECHIEPKENCCTEQGDCFSLNQFLLDDNVLEVMNNHLSMNLTKNWAEEHPDCTAKFFHPSTQIHPFGALHCGFKNKEINLGDQLNEDKDDSNDDKLVALSEEKLGKYL
jgi:hypothetical protein